MSWRDARDLRQCINLLYDEFLPLFDAVEADCLDKLEVYDKLAELRQLLRAMEAASQEATQ